MPPLTRGPLPARVYWRRRMVLLSVAVLLVVGLARLLGSGSDASSEPEARQAAAGTTAGTSPELSSGSSTGPAAPTVTVTAGAGAVGKHRSSKAPVLAAPDGPCEATDIEVSPEVKDSVGGPSGGTRIELALQTRKAEACTWQVSARNLTMKISSGHDDVWSSRQCPRTVPDQDVVVRREVPTTVEVTWNGQRSDDGCPRAAAWALPGWYHVTVAAMGGEPTDSQFELRAPSAPVITRTPKPEQSKKHDGQAEPSSSGSASSPESPASSGTG